MQMAWNPTFCLAVLLANACCAVVGTIPIEDPAPDANWVSEGQSATSETEGFHRLGDVVEGAATLPILDRWNERMRLHTSLTFRVVRMTFRWLDFDGVAWEYTSKGYLTYQQPSQYTLALTPTDVNPVSAAEITPRESRWNYDGRVLRFSNGTDRTQSPMPTASRVFMDCVPLELAFCIDPVELSRKYYVYLCPVRLLNSSVYHITAQPTTEEAAINDVERIELFVDVNTLLLRRIHVHRSKSLVSYDLEYEEASHIESGMSENASPKRHRLLAAAYCGNQLTSNTRPIAASERAAARRTPLQRVRSCFRRSQRRGWKPTSRATRPARRRALSEW